MSDKLTIFEKLAAVKTKPELDALRLETVDAMKSAGAADWQKVQQAFIRASNRLRRIPLRERTW